jgi:chemotaxis protein methyltransferase CheR
MDQRTFQQLRKIVYENSGINLNDSKVAMVTSRIAKRMRVLGIKSPEDYLKYLTADQHGEETTNFLNVISTNVTSFFREHQHFEFLGENVSEWLNNGRKKIRIWCAASSTGEEPYTIAMTLLLASTVRNADMKILATDISTMALAKAQAGIYDAEAMDKVPQNLKERFFITRTEADKKYYIANDCLKKMIIFRRLNLSKTPFPINSLLDVVFCRNVMIYFNAETRTKLVSEIFRLLRPEGYLITGHAESLASTQTKLKCIKPSYYQKI